MVRPCQERRVDANSEFALSRCSFVADLFQGLKSHLTLPAKRISHEGISER